MKKHGMNEVIRDPKCRECGIRTLHLYRVKGLDRERVKMCAICATLALEEMEIFQMNTRREANEQYNENVRGKTSNPRSDLPRGGREGVRGNSPSGEKLDPASQETSGSGINRLDEGHKKEGNQQTESGETCATCEEAASTRKS